MSPPSVVFKAFQRGAAPKYLAIFVAALLLPALVAYLPVAAFFQEVLDRSPVGQTMANAFDSSALVDLMRELGEPVGAGVNVGITGALIVGLFLAPALAGAAAEVARTDDAVGARELVGAAGSFYGRMLRMTFVGFLPLGLAAGLGAAVMALVKNANAKAVLESTGTRNSNLGVFACVVLVWLAHVTIEAGRAQLAADATRTGALRAWWSGARFAVRHFRQVLPLCLATSLAGTLAAAILTAIRLRLPQGNGVGVAVAFLLAQLAVAAVAWGRSSTLVGLVALLRADGERG
ncbi:MAG TPA: hypothetical protein VGI39_09575 [Polyangiaceae bacterium]|jgi:hypothetical protein